MDNDRHDLTLSACVACALAYLAMPAQALAYESAGGASFLAATGDDTVSPVIILVIAAVVVGVAVFLRMRRR